MKPTYKNSGVNLRAGERFVDSIKLKVKKTFNRNVLSGIGNFASFYKIPETYNKPVFASSTDGVGTKIKIAIELNRHSTIGEDLVNHCVNDIAVCGAEPLFFLDYMAFGKLKTKVADELMTGLINGCRKNSIALIGGETAEMPGIYSENDYDLAGTIVGIVERAKILNKKNVKTGDVLIGLKSSGLHTNGYSLARKIFSRRIKLTQYMDSLGCTLSEELMKVHRSYLKIIRVVLSEVKVASISHITGGGIIGNTTRVVPLNLKMNIDWKAWKQPPVFELIQRTGKISDSEMRKVFNLGIGLIFIVREKYLEKLKEILKKHKEKYFLIGEIKNL